MSTDKPTIRIAEDLQHLLTDASLIKLWDGNPKLHDLPAIAGSMEDHTVYEVVVAQKSSGRVMVGNGRAETMIAAGLTQIPVVWLDVDDATAAEIVLRNNKSHDRGGYDDLATTELLDWVKSVNGSVVRTGYTDDEHTKIMDDLARAAADSPLRSGTGPMAGYDGPAATVDSADLFGDDEPDRYREQYAVMVVCSDAEDQAETYAKLKSIGYNAKVVTT